jgi:chromosomal replication initiator protein
MHKAPLTFARFLPTPENRSALIAAQAAADGVASRKQRPANNPLFLHGPAGTGKTHLVSALVEQATQARPDLVACVLAAGDLAPADRDQESSGHDRLEAARAADLVVIEDLQHLPAGAVDGLAALVDYLQARDVQMVFTALAGPQLLAPRGKRLPARLASRLAAGLVVRLAPLRAAGRLALLEDMARRRQAAVAPEVLRWLADNLTGGARPLHGALTRIEALARLQKRPPDLAAVRELFREQADAAAVTVEQIASRVGACFQVEPAQLQSRRRYRGVLLPRQVSMYLARQLTSLSLDQIGAYFGGRDHSTVLHACRKVERAMNDSPSLSGAVRQLHADLA